MSSTENLLERITELIRTQERSDLQAVLSSMAEINQRLDKLETAHERPITSNLHPSLDHFAIAEAIADAVIAGKEKACTFEPNGKPCDHCSMCSSRGF